MIDGRDVQLESDHWGYWHFEEEVSGSDPANLLSARRYRSERLISPSSKVSL